MRVILTEPEPGMADSLVSLLSVNDETEIVGLAQDGLETAQMAVQVRPDVLLVHENMPAVDGYDVCRLVKMAAPAVACVLVVDRNDPTVVPRAMLAGANALLSPDSKTDQVMEIIEACAGGSNIVHSEEYAAVTDPTKMPMTVGLISAKDGIGKTTLAVNLSALFAQRFPDSVVLADMYAQLGDVGLLLNLPPQGSLVDLADYADELDIELVNTHLSTHRNGLRVLCGATTPKPVGLEVISVPYMASLLGILRRNYRFLLCDLPPTLWSGSLYVLSRCQIVLVITNLFELTTIRDTNSLLRIIIDGGYASEANVRLVVNRAAPQDRFSASDLEDATGMKIDFTLPNDTETVVTAGNRGEPFVLEQPRAPVSRGIAKLADAIVESIAGPAEQPALGGVDGQPVIDQSSKE